VVDGSNWRHENPSWKKHTFEGLPSTPNTTLGGPVEMLILPGEDADGYYFWGEQYGG